ncbi:MAG: 5'-nucleotidase C-terminal domain-containing protein [Bacteroidaceae bacterium]|nr:5'-nucleotidase C-terminal domain-containing protein [Bacteroidaceae bacterium]
MKTNPLFFILFSLHSTLYALFSASASAQPLRVVGYTATRHEITHLLDMSPDRGAQQLLDRYSPAVDSLVKPVLGICDGGMDVRRPECALSNWVSDVMREAAEKQWGRHIDVGLSNMGGLRSVMPDGEVNVGHVYEIAPFENYLSLLTLRGDALTELCRNIVASGGEAISGLRIEATADRQLVSAKVGGEDIVADREYTVATSNYLADGNDKMLALKQALRREDTKVPLRDLFMDAIRRCTARGEKVKAQVEGRITVVTAAAPHMAPPLALPHSVRILHTNDTHSQILPYNPLSTNREMADKGGFVRRATYLARERRRSPDFLLLDAGDFSQGSPYYNLFRGEVEVRLMNHMGYDACTIGNHEFDFGLEGMERIFRMAQFKVVNCNYDFSATALAGLVHPYIIIERAGVRVGITGVGCALDGMVMADNCPGVVYRDPVESLNAVVRTLRDDEHCDLVVCLSHMGVDEDRRVVAATAGIDCVIGGHSHTYLELPVWVRNTDGRDIPICQMGKTGRFLGDMRIDLE